MKETKNPNKQPSGKRRVSKKVEFSYAVPQPPQPAVPKGVRQFKTIEGKQRNKHFRRFRTITAFLIIAAVALILVFLNSLAPGGLIEFSENFYAGLGSGAGYPVRLPDEKIESIYPIGSDILVLTDAALLEYNQSARQIFNRQHGMEQPVVDAISSRTLIYDRGGKKLKIENKHKTVFELTTEQPIILAAIGGDGSFAVATQSTRYNAEIYVYSGDNFQKLYSRALVTGEITALDISDDGKNIAYSVATVNEGRFVSQVYICNTKKEPPIASQTYEETFVMALDYKNGNQIAVLGDKIFSTLSGDGDRRTDYDFGVKTLKLTDRSSKTCTAVMLSDQTGDIEGQLLLFSAQGEILSDFIWDQDLRSIAVSDDGVFGFYGGQLAYVDRQGKLIKEWEIGQDISNIAEQDGRAVVLNHSEVSILDPHE